MRSSDLIGDRDSETNQIEEHARSRTGQSSEVNLGLHSLDDMVPIVVKLVQNPTETKKISATFPTGIRLIVASYA